MARILLGILITCTPSLFAQEGEAVYIIRGISYNISGKTKESALERAGEFKTGVSFTGLEALEEYIAGKKQDLCNIRALDENAVSISFSLGEMEENGAIPVYLEVYVTDSRNLVIMPQIKYDSNSGLSVKLKTRAYNFLGTLTEQQFDLAWENNAGSHSLGFLLDIAIPFRAFGFNWTVTSFNELKGYLTGEPLYDINTLGLSMEIPVFFTTITIGAEQGIVVHEENTKKIQNYEGTADKYHSWYFFSRLFAEWKIPTPLHIGKFGAVVYTPGVYGIANYKGGSYIGDYRRGIGAGVTQEIGFGKIDWIGNFRSGIKVSAFNGNEYNFFRKAWNIDAGLLAQGHFRVCKLFGISARLLYTKWFNDYYDQAGDAVRGLKDGALEAKSILALNMDFPFRVLRFVPSEWTGNRKWRYFDFELHLSLFADLAMAESIDGSYRFRPADIIPGIGAEAIIFPLTWRSFFFRVSAGWDIREAARIGKLPTGIHRELYFGTGHFY